MFHYNSAGDTGGKDDMCHVFRRIPLSENMPEGLE